MVLQFAIRSKLVQAGLAIIPKLWAGQSISEVFRDIGRQVGSTSNLCSDILRYQNVGLTKVSGQVAIGIQTSYLSTSVAFKTSLILLYYRIFGVIRSFRYVCILAEAIVACYFVVCLFVTIFKCKPVPYHWNKNRPRESCINEPQFYR